MKQRGRQFKQQPAEKKCTLCGVVKPTSEFYTHAQKPNCFHSRCKTCSNNKAIESRRKKPLTVLQNKIYTLKYVYKMTWEQYQTMMSSQAGACAVCHQQFEMDGVHGRVGKNKPCVDHNHKTGQVRGIICGQCNRGIGFLGDDVERVRSALTYLERHQ